MREDQLAKLNQDVVVVNTKIKSEQATLDDLKRVRDDREAFLMDYR